MNSVKKGSRFPLWTFGFLCLSTILLCHLRVSLSVKNLPEEAPRRPHQCHWTIWNHRQPSNECGLFLKAVIMVSSPLLPLTSTLFLVAGVVRKNLYLFLPWLLFAVEGLLSVQGQNLEEMYRGLWRSEASCERWKFLCIYSVVIVLDMAGCLCYREVFRVFRELWSVEPDALPEILQEHKEQLLHEVAAKKEEET